MPQQLERRVVPAISVLEGVRDCAVGLGEQLPGGGRDADHCRLADRGARAVGRGQGDESRMF